MCTSLSLNGKKTKHHGASNPGLDREMGRHKVLPGKEETNVYNVRKTDKWR